jgi:hypothetical protein
MMALTGKSLCTSGFRFLSKKNSLSLALIFSSVLSKIEPQRTLNWFIIQLNILLALRA